MEFGEAEQLLFDLTALGLPLVRRQLEPRFKDLLSEIRFQ